MEYRFIKTVQRDNGWVAMFADKDILGESGVAAMRSASKMSNVFNTIRVREGVHFLNSKEVKETISKLQGLEKTEMIENLKRAKEVLASKEPSSKKAFNVASGRIDYTVAKKVEIKAPAA